MDQLTHMQTAERLVPNAGMLVHQGALPHGMRTELANFGNAKELNLWGERWVGEPPGKKPKGKDDEPEGSADTAEPDKGGGDSESEDEDSTDGIQ